MSSLLGRASAPIVFLGSLLVGCGADEPSSTPSDPSESPSVEVARPGSLTFDRYHTVEEFESYLRSVPMTHPDLTRVIEIGQSREGRPILALEINNPDTGPIEEKPGFYVDGNIHGGEVLGGEAALYFVDRLLGDYGTDPGLTELVDGTGFFVIPLVNPDGRAVSIDTPENHRWNTRPTDQDGDGLIDEDPPEDLDGDGRHLQMRVRDSSGPWMAHPTDSRRNVRVGRGGSVAAPGAVRFQVYSEGIDNDGDGRFNEDQVGGVDLNRNFPSNWSAAQFASGPFPLSEPETHALVEYITARPSIAAIHTFHTSGGLLLRFPTLADQDWDFPQSDLEDYNEIAAAGVPLTGYDNYAYGKKPIVDLMSPGHGVFNDWASNVFGVLAMTTEMWKGTIGQGEDAQWAWNDEVLGGEGFIDWYDFDHPDLGLVQLGGWDRWSTSNPPERLILGELERNFDWVLTFAERVPRVELLESRISAIPGQPGRYRVEAVLANVGWMPTATQHALRTLRTAVPVQASLSVEGGEVVDPSTPNGIYSWPVLPGAREGGPVPHALTWTVEFTDPSDPGLVDLVIRSQKAGTVHMRLSPASG